MKKIVFLHPVLDAGGAENLRYTLLRNIDRKKFIINICCIGRKGSVGEKIEGLGYKVDELRKNPFSLGLDVTCKLVRYLKKEKPDILHCSLFNANFHGRLAAFLCHIPHVVTEEHGEHKQYIGIKFFPYILADFILSRLNDFIICCSDKLREDIIKKERLAWNKVVTIENCLDLDMYKIDKDREEVRRRHKISNEVVFIEVASLKEGKGHAYLMEVLREIKDMGYCFKCFFAGSGPLREMLYKKCHELGLLDEIIFLGNIEAIADYLNASDVFLLPSFSEGLSVALMEAMSMGLPSIVTDVGSNPDLIKTGFNGTVILPGDRQGLKNALIFYLQNKQVIKEFGSRSRSIIETKYSSMDKYTKEYYELWDKCADNER